MTESEKPDEKPAVATNENQAQKADISGNPAKSGDETAPVVEQKEEILHNPPAAKPESEEPPAPPPEPKEKRKPPPKSAKPKKKEMKGKPKRDPQTGKLLPLEISHQQAFREFVLLGQKGTHEQLHEKLIARMGEDKAPSFATIRQWSATHNWYRRRLSAITGADPLQIDEQLSSLQTLVTHVSSETIDGLIAQAMSTTSTGLQNVEVKSASDVGQMIKNLEALIQVKTVYRHTLQNIPGVDSIDVDSDDEEKKEAEPKPTIGAFKENISKGGDVK